MHKASEPNPVGLLGAMWIIEGLGEKMASNWAGRIEALTGFDTSCTRFVRYHADNDDSHMDKLYGLIDRICTSPQAADEVVRTATVVGRSTPCSWRRSTVAGEPIRYRSAFMRAAAADNTLPMDRAATHFWLRDVQNPLRWLVRPVLQFLFAAFLHITWLLKRLPLPQFRAHGFLQWMICWFCRNFVSVEANVLILRHFATESNILNFLRDNTEGATVEPLQLYPQKIDDLMKHTFVNHDQELFRMFEQLGSWDRFAADAAGARDQVDELAADHRRARRDPEAAVAASGLRDLARAVHVPVLLPAHGGGVPRLHQRVQSRPVDGDSYRADRRRPDACGARVQQVSAVSRGAWNLAQRFLMHGFFTEHLYARLEELRLKTRRPEAVVAAWSRCQPGRGGRRATERLRPSRLPSREYPRSMRRPAARSVPASTA